MDKKSIIALVLIAVVILTLPYYQKLVTGDQVVQQTKTKDTLITKEKIQKEVETPKPVITEEKVSIQKQDQNIADSNESIKNRLLVVEDSVEKVFKISSDKLNIVLSNKGGGAIKKFVLNKYAVDDSTMVNMVDPAINNDIFLAFQNNQGEYIRTDEFMFSTNKSAGTVFLNENDSYRIVFSLLIDGEVVKKSYTFYGDSYHFDVEIYFSNPAKTLLNRQYQFGWKNGLPSTESYKSDDNTYNQAYVYMGEELENYEISDPGKGEMVTLSGKADWLAIRTKYFLGSISNINTNVSNGIYFSGEGIQQEDYVQRIYDVGFNARYENQAGDSMRVYLGPLDHKELGKYDTNLDILIMNNGWYERVFRFFSLLVLKVLELLHMVIPNYGIVIIVFSVLIKLLVYPLTRKSYTSMKEMQRISPLVAELKEKYKGDAQRLNKETMKLYKEHGVNPLGGCLPTLIQMPLLISLFIVFRSTIQLRGAMFIPGWITDLSRTDTLFNLPFSLPMYGDEFNLLPILMAVTMLFQSKMTMQDPKQKAMVYMMPVFMLLIFNRFPSGLNLYYTLFNLLTIIQQKFITTGSAPIVIPEKTKKQKRKK